MAREDPLSRTMTTTPKERRNGRSPRRRRPFGVRSDDEPLKRGSQQQRLACQDRGVVGVHMGGLAAWLLGCLAAWLLGCLAAWLLGCLAAWLLGHSTASNRPNEQAGGARESADVVAAERALVAGVGRAGDPGDLAVLEARLDERDGAVRRSHAARGVKGRESHPRVTRDTSSRRTSKSTTGPSDRSMRRCSGLARHTTAPPSSAASAAAASVSTTRTSNRTKLSTCIDDDVAASGGGA